MGNKMFRGFGTCLPTLSITTSSVILVLVALGGMIFVLFNEEIKEDSSSQRVAADAAKRDTSRTHYSMVAMIWRMVGPAGFEPATPRFLSRSSISRVLFGVGW